MLVKGWIYISSPLRHFPVFGPLVRRAGLTMVQSSPLSLISFSCTGRSAKRFLNSVLSSNFSGQNILRFTPNELTNNRRSTLPCCMALIMLGKSWEIALLGLNKAFLVLFPKTQITALTPFKAWVMAWWSERPPSTIVKLGCFAASIAWFRQKAVTWRPCSKPWETTYLPVPPVALIVWL